VPTLLSVKPGMTGLWQVSGRSSIPFPERAQLDLEYVRGWSFLGDLWILALTPAAVLIRRGAH
jgi:lipopolysaccharide/colanic/teichoic acid biosynthesis glycosyltransferase